jgi:hypothetical protein
MIDVGCALLTMTTLASGGFWVLVKHAPSPHDASSIFYRSLWSVARFWTQSDLPRGLSVMRHFMYGMCASIAVLCIFAGLLALVRRPDTPSSKDPRQQRRCLENVREIIEKEQWVVDLRAEAAAAKSARKALDTARETIAKEQWVSALRVEAATAKSTGRALEAAKAQIAWFAKAYETQGVQLKQLKQRAETASRYQQQLENSLHVCDSHVMSIATLKRQLADKDSIVKGNLNLITQLTAEKEHLLEALSKSQREVQNQKELKKIRDAESRAFQAHFNSVKIQLSSTADRLKLFSDAQAHQAKQLKSVSSNLLTTEGESSCRQNDLNRANNRLSLIQTALRKSGLTIDIFTIPLPDLATRLRDIASTSSSAQETALATTCSDLTVANSQLQDSLFAAEARAAQKSADLEDFRHQYHAMTLRLESELAKAYAKQEIPTYLEQIKSLKRELTAVSVQRDRSFDLHAQEQKNMLAVREVFPQFIEKIKALREKNRILREEVEKEKGLREQGDAERVRDCAMLHQARLKVRGLEKANRQLERKLEMEEEGLVEVEEEEERKERTCGPKGVDYFKDPLSYSNEDYDRSTYYLGCVEGSLSRSNSPPPSDPAPQLRQPRKQIITILKPSAYVELDPQPSTPLDETKTTTNVNVNASTNTIDNDADHDVEIICQRSSDSDFELLDADEDEDEEDEQDWSAFDDETEKNVPPGVNMQ